jgi:hypothetical protein
MRIADFILLPDFQVFETAILAKNSEDQGNACLILFTGAWTYYIDSRDKIIIISQELNRQLVESHYKSAKKKRQALFSVVDVYSENMGCEHEISQIRLASSLTIKGGKKVYYVTDNEKIRYALTNFKLFEVISSEQAVELLKSLE